MKITIYLREVYAGLISKLERLDTSGHIDDETILKLFNILESFAIIRGNTNNIKKQDKLRIQLLSDLGIKYPVMTLNGFRHSIAHYGYIRNIEFATKGQKSKIVWGIGHSGYGHHFGKNLINIDFQKLRTDLIVIIQEELSKTSTDMVFKKAVIDINKKGNSLLIKEFKQYLNEN